MKNGFIFLCLILQYTSVISQNTDRCVSGNCINGTGIMVYANGNIYEGNWLNGKKEGQGNYFLNNGNRYSGEWKDDKKNGQGKYYKKYNKIQEGFFIDFIDDYFDIIVKEPSINASSVQKTGKLDDCRYILSEGCQNYLLQSKASDILPQISDAYISDDGEFVSNGFRGELIKATGGIFEVKFQKTKSVTNQPAENLKWGESIKNVEKKYGKPLQIFSQPLLYGDKVVTYSYIDFELEFYKKELRSVLFSRNFTKSEREKDSIYEKKEMEAWSIKNTPINKLIKLIKAQEKLENNLNKYIKEINELTIEYNKIVAINGTTAESKTLRNRIFVLKNTAIPELHYFLALYGDQLTPKNKAYFVEVEENLKNIR